MSDIETTVSEHFLSNSHSVSHMLLLTIETVKYECDCPRKAREASLIHRAKPSSLWEWKNVTNYGHYVIFTI